MAELDHYNMLGSLEPTDPLYRYLDMFNAEEFGMDELVRRLSESLPQEVYLVAGQERKRIPEAYGHGEVVLTLGPTGIIGNLHIEPKPFMIYPPLNASKLMFQVGDQVLYQAPEQDMRTKIALALGDI